MNRDELRDAATAALNAAVRRDGDTAIMRLDTIAEAVGWRGVRYAMSVWCDMLAEHLCDGPPGQRRIYAFRALDPDTGEMTTGDDDRLDPESRWVMDLIEARLAHDPDRWNELLGQIPDGEEVDRVLALLSAISGTIAILPRGIGLTGPEFMTGDAESGR